MFFSGIECDICGKTLTYSDIVGKRYQAAFAREKGWVIGKVHKCPECQRNPRKKK